MREMTFIHWTLTELLQSFKRQFHSKMLTRVEFETIFRCFSFTCKLFVVPLEWDETALKLSLTTSKYKKCIFTFHSMFSFLYFVFCLYRIPKDLVAELKLSFEQVLFHGIFLFEILCVTIFDLNSICFSQSTVLVVNQLIYFNSRTGN